MEKQKICTRRINITYIAIHIWLQVRTWQANPNEDWIPTSLSMAAYMELT